METGHIDYEYLKHTLDKLGMIDDDELVYNTETLADTINFVEDLMTYNSQDIIKWFLVNLFYEEGKNENNK